MARLRDIAQRAGVSATTVSHVLNHSRYVRSDTRERVLAAVQEFDYRPNMLARSLRRRKTNTIGLLVSDIGNPFFAELARSVETTAYERGYNVILCNTDESLEKEVRYVDVLFARQVDGLILAPAPGDHSFLKAYLDRNARVVLVNRYLADAQVPAVVTDDEEATFVLASRLLEAGHRRIGAVLGVEGVSTTESRVAGLRRALDEHGQRLTDAWMFAGHSRREGGYRAAQALSTMAEPPTAVIALNSLMLDGILLGLLDLAPKLLRRLEVTGIGYSALAHVLRSSRFGVTQPADGIGRVAAALLLDALDGRASWCTDRVTLKTRLVELESAPFVSPVPDQDGSRTT